MEILLVAGSIYQIIYSKIAYKKYIINKKAIYISELLELIRDRSLRFNVVIILDQGIDQSMDEIRELMQHAREVEGCPRIIWITRDLEIRQLEKEWSIYFQDKVRIAWSDYDEILEQILQEDKQVRKGFFGERRSRQSVGEKQNANRHYGELTEQEDEGLQSEGDREGIEVGVTEREEPPERISLRNRFRKNKQQKKKEEDPEEDKRFRLVSRGISKVAAVTGHRGVGITSTVVNLGYESAKKGLNTIVIDLDIDNRTTNLYFGEFIRQAEQDEYLGASLMKCLAKPQDYKNSACNIGENLWLTSLSYDFEDERLMQQFYQTRKLINMITVLKQSFNMILIDIPLEILGSFHEIIPMVDVFGLCCNNSQYSIITTLRNLGNHFTSEEISYINAKSKLIITKYNDRAEYEGDFFTPDKVSELFDSDLCDEFTIKMPLAGYIRYNEAFDLQVESDIPITQTNMEVSRAYANILLRLIGGGI